MVETKVEEGLVHCNRFGKITGIDCSCLRDNGCKGCFIYESYFNSSLVEDNDLEAVSLADVSDFQISELSPVN